MVMETKKNLTLSLRPVMMTTAQKPKKTMITAMQKVAKSMKKVEAQRSI
ncbi:MAG: hypothetical protein JKY95_13890 [Planctomycetaceae bacterium]|nr:hypothetical protein [Planctomycetaceae bacterium]